MITNNHGNRLLFTRYFFLSPARNRQARIQFWKTLIRRPLCLVDKFAILTYLYWCYRLAVMLVRRLRFGECGGRNPTVAWVLKLKLASDSRMRAAVATAEHYLLDKKTRDNERNTGLGTDLDDWCGVLPRVAEFFRRDWIFRFACIEFDNSSSSGLLWNTWDESQ